VSKISPEQTGLPRPLRRDAQRNRERILEAAREVFAERGVGATLDHIAARAGVGVGTVYRRYPNKDALLDELCEDWINDLAAFAEEALASRDPWKAFIAFLERVEEASAANRALEHLIVGSPRGPERVARARERLAEPIEALVERAQKQGKLRADFDASDVAVLHAMVAAAFRETSELSPELWRRYLGLIVDGLASKRSSTTDTGIGSPGPLGRRPAVRVTRPD
jgi:AcrR family transcriptional regulator